LEIEAGLVRAIDIVRNPRGRPAKKVTDE